MKVKYVIKQEDSDKIKEVPVTVSEESDSLILIVGKWCVFELCDDGAGRLCGCIPKDNEEGLQIEKGHIKLRD